MFQSGTPLPSPVGSPGPRQLGRTVSEFTSPLSEFFWSDNGNPYAASSPEDMIRISAGSIRLPDLIAAFSSTALENADHDILDLYESDRSQVLKEYLTKQTHLIEILQCLTVDKPPADTPLGERAQTAATLVYCMFAGSVRPLLTGAQTLFLRFQIALWSRRLSRPKIC